MLRVAWLALALVAEAYRPGLACRRVYKPGTSNYLKYNQSSELIRNTTIIVATTAWKPFSMKDPSSPSGWAGIDFEILERLRSMLGFNYTVIEFGKLEGEDWTMALLRIASQADIVLTYWGQTSERLDKLRLLRGHVDLSCAPARPSIAQPSLCSATRVTQLHLCFASCAQLGGCHTHRLSGCVFLGTWHVLHGTVLDGPLGTRNPHGGPFWSMRLLARTQLGTGRETQQLHL